MKLTDITYSLFTFLVFISWSCTQNEQQTENSEEVNLIVDILQSRESPVIDSVLSDPDRYQIQILYTQIDRDENNNPSFTEYAYGVNPNNYFYPASVVKFPVALLALQKLDELGIEGLDKYSTMLTDSAFEGQTKVRYDSTSESRLPSVAHYIKKIFIVSDNDAYNRLYEFLGQDYINNELYEKGYEDVRIVHRLAIFNNAEQNRNTNPVMFYDNAKLLYQQDLVSSPRQWEYDQPIPLGEGFIRNDSLIKEPKDFGQNNFISVANLQAMMKSVIFPEAVPEEQRFNLSEEDYDFLYQYMSQLPRETTFPDYIADTTENFYDSYSKFFMYGDKQEAIPSNIRIFNKIGMAYGFLTDNAYILDLENNVEFFLTAVIYVNENQIFNDNVYEYDKIGLPFLGELGRAIYEYEIVRERGFQPDLSKFKVTYDKEDNS
ncbi:serine hydrolase [Catalinimonas niigatensis]|uniref:serine hydrolase n=1 Tax=Catalinimonas niigatensis TaxID=1397264 RepID=UPI0026658F58|nr:serine hydrolase [Catalinimonas niigatensis]WPP48078.1 serine hydrolase [Catalinimonas niigatensis]